ncbi:microfibril-associated glycoprotein 4 [Stomoxys calcitrans]|uniref:microfibril-associated glycoprotein 4 n=1 Tax=Stomoxys calcitrans TaxID=35570 RepID=UPI0027E39032|nr:microfibril-associated glycoprotein 4 [Stomoxys calcitrans]
MPQGIFFISFFILMNFVCSSFANYEKSDTFVQFENMMMQHQLLAEMNEMKTLLRELNHRFEENESRVESPLTESPIFDIRYDVIPEKCATNYTPINCHEATACTKRNGIYKIQIDSYSYDPFLVECDAKTENGGWIVIQKRQDGSEDFYRDWKDYKNGFGSLPGEFWIGLDKLFALTHYLGSQELLIVMEDEGVNRYARYSNFIIGNESDYYSLKSLGKYTGNAGDSLSHHLGMKFTTKDRDNDEDANNCAETFKGAWWHRKCHVSNLNGKYGDHAFGRGVNWHTFKNYTRSIQYVKMMIRRRRE